VGRPDVRDDANIGIDEPAEQIDLAERAHAHLDDCGPVPAIECEQRERHADVVVEIPLVLENRTPAPEDAGKHFLGRGLAVAARDAGKGDRKFFPVRQSHLLEGEQRVLYGEDVLDAAQAFIAQLQRGPVHERAPGPLLDSIANKIVAVEPVSLEGYEEFTFLDVPGVYGHALDLHPLHPLEKFVQLLFFRIVHIKPRNREVKTQKAD